MILKNRLKELRARDGLNQSELAKLAGVSRQSISLLERGEYTPSVIIAITIAQIFKEPVENVFSLVEGEEQSARYRFWRNVGIITVSGLIGGVIGFLTEMFGSEKPLEIQSFFSKEVLLLGSAVLFLVAFILTITLLMCARKVHQKMLQIEDDDEAYHYDIQKKKLYGLATIFKGIMILPYFLFVIFYSQLVDLDRPGAGDMAFIFGDFTMLYLFLVLIALFFLSDIFFRKTFHLIYGKPIPRNANAKEVREFMMSMMDEAEKQISYEENYEIIIKLSNYILPISLIAIFLVGIAFHTDILLALVVVSLIYLYILVSQYKITKRYYKE